MLTKFHKSGFFVFFVVVNLLFFIIFGLSYFSIHDNYRMYNLYEVCSHSTNINYDDIIDFNQLTVDRDNAEFTVKFLEKTNGKEVDNLNYIHAKVNFLRLNFLYSLIIFVILNIISFIISVLIYCFMIWKQFKTNDSIIKNNIFINLFTFLMPVITCITLESMFASLTKYMISAGYTYIEYNIKIVHIFTGVVFGSLFIGIILCFLYRSFCNKYKNLNNNALENSDNNSSNDVGDDNNKEIIPNKNNINKIPNVLHTYGFNEIKNVNGTISYIDKNNNVGLIDTFGDVYFIDNNGVATYYFEDGTTYHKDYKGNIVK